MLRLPISLGGSLPWQVATEKIRRRSPVGAGSDRRVGFLPICGGQELCRLLPQLIGRSGEYRRIPPKNGPDAGQRGGCRK